MMFQIEKRPAWNVVVSTVILIWMSFRSEDQTSCTIRGSTFNKLLFPTQCEQSIECLWSLMCDVVAFEVSSLDTHLEKSSLCEDTIVLYSTTCELCPTLNCVFLRHIWKFIKESTSTVTWYLFQSSLTYHNNNSNWNE